MLQACYKHDENYHLLFHIEQKAQRVSFHAGNVIGSYQDIGFAEIQRWFNVYTFDNPMFYQNSSYQATVNSCPRSMSRFTRYDPINPHPPVTNDFIKLSQVKNNSY